MGTFAYFCFDSLLWHAPSWEQIDFLRGETGNLLESKTLQMIFKSHRRMKNTTLSRMILAVWSSAIRESRTRLLYIEKAEALKAQYNRSCWNFQKSFPHWDNSTVFWRLRWRIWFHCNIYLHFYLSYQKSMWITMVFKSKVTITSFAKYCTFQYFVLITNLIFVCFTSCYVNDGMQRYVFHHIYLFLLFR